MFCFSGWKDTIGTFASGGGRLFDLEFLVDEQGRRVVAFGPWAGTVGTSLGLMQWAAHFVGEVKPLSCYYLALVCCFLTTNVCSR